MATIEATAPDGTAITTPKIGGETGAGLDEQLRAAQTAYDANPESADTLLLLGQRTPYRGRMRDAIAHFSDGIARFPEDARFYRHRGHRYLSVRAFDAGVADFTEAARLVAGQPIIPETSPNAKPGDAPTSLQFSIWYHLGLANYLLGDWDAAHRAYGECTAVAYNDEAMVAVTHWHYMTQRRAGHIEASQRVLAPIHAGMAVTENLPYYRLTLLYTGALTPDAVLGNHPDDPDKGVGSNRALMDATAGYGVGNWHLYNGHRAEAEAAFRGIIASTPPGMAQFAFGYIAAETDLARM